MSHDSGFLDRVCSDIIHYCNRKLKVYKGNLTAFVAAVPEAQSYYKLEATEQEWRLPEPGFLEGVKSKDKAILKMHNVAFQYEGRDAPTFTGATLQVSLSSRVACVGPNGAGKSTLIKVLTGETEATEGNVWKHPNLRIAYVAQHAFHHIGAFFFLGWLRLTFRWCCAAQQRQRRQRRRRARALARDLPLAAPRSPHRSFPSAANAFLTGLRPHALIFGQNRAAFGQDAQRVHPGAFSGPASLKKSFFGAFAYGAKFFVLLSLSALLLLHIMCVVSAAVV